MVDENTHPLVLVPTALEMQLLLGLRPESYASLEQPGNLPGSPSIGIAGFGLAAAGAIASGHLANHETSHCYLVGVAGTYDQERAPIGSTVAGTSVHLWGIGVGCGDRHTSAAELGFPPAPGIPDTPLPLVTPGQPPLATGSILSVSCGSATPDEAKIRHAAFQDVLLEDMETWSVALACRMFDVPLTVIRGVSNCAGHRDKADWRLEEALQGVLAALTDALEHGH